MRSERVSSGVILLSVFFLEACGSSSITPNNSPAPAGSAPVSLVMRDTPPSGVTVLSFEISVLSATLNSSGGNAPLITGDPIRVEVEHLQIENAFLDTTKVPAGTYDSITVTFANPEMTILNNSGAAIGTCANGAKCELTPTLNPASVTFTGAPFPLTITANLPAGLLLDFNLNNSIQSDLSVAPAITFTQLTVKPGQDGQEGEVEEIDDVKGQITAVDATNSTITVQDNYSGQSFTAKVDSDTEIEGFDEIGLPNSFSSLQVGQIVELGLMLLSDGTFKAKKVELKLQDDADQNQLEGMVVAIDSPTEFKMVLEDEAPDDVGIEVGNVLTVTIQSGAAFQIETDGITLPSTVTFQSSADLLVGQGVQIRTPSGNLATAVTTDQVTLRRTQTTATVLATSGVNFTVSDLTSLFTNAVPPITQIDVMTTPQTKFEDVSDATGLKVGDVVSLRGLLFKTAANPLLVADSVYKREAED
ncbi:MAG: DUF5666 domain-containing protein [bacterium]